MINSPFPSIFCERDIHMLRMYQASALLENYIQTHICCFSWEVISREFTNIAGYSTQAMWTKYFTGGH